MKKGNAQIFDRSRILFCWVLLFSPTPDLTFMQKINSEKQTRLAVYRAAEANNDPVFFG